MKIKLLESCGIFVFIMSLRCFDINIDKFNKKDIFYSILGMVVGALIFILV